MSTTKQYGYRFRHGPIVGTSATRQRAIEYALRDQQNTLALTGLNIPFHIMTREIEVIEGEWIEND